MCFDVDSDGVVVQSKHLCVVESLFFRHCLSHHLEFLYFCFVFRQSCHVVFFSALVFFSSFFFFAFFVIREDTFRTNKQHSHSHAMSAFDASILWPRGQIQRELRRHLSQMTDTLRCTTLNSVSLSLSHTLAHSAACPPFVNIPFSPALGLYAYEINVFVAFFRSQTGTAATRQQQPQQRRDDKKCSSPKQIQRYQGIKSSIYVGLACFG